MSDSGLLQTVVPGPCAGAIMADVRPSVRVGSGSCLMVAQVMAANAVSLILRNAQKRQRVPAGACSGRCVLVSYVLRHVEERLAVLAASVSTSSFTS